MKKNLKYFLRAAFVLFIIFNIAAIFYAYKFTHFYEPGNTIVKKPDTKTNWQRIMDALTGRNVLKFKNIISPNADFETVYLTTRNNLKLEGWYIKTDSVVRG